ncbi:MAG: right-handed parallel beta-helix repeat-containing protein [Verrucomicrobiae bacterium]|nr:right-handed parallel beta-helix repeat-containing protein [Verrucomicrobiae bacterium]NNJ43608.1 right-handed parallel beta-helix repeat-containing protein [Akkermansiaceae bacterium]
MAWVAPQLQATDYFINSKLGDDSQAGIHPDQAWKSLGKVNSRTFNAGDRILFARGSDYTGALILRGSGEFKGLRWNPIEINAYGDGPLPRIQAKGKHLAPLQLIDCEGWEVRNLELSNKGDLRKPNRFGVLIKNKSLRVARHFVLEGLLIKDVNGSYRKTQQSTGGAILVTQDGLVDRRFDSILIHKNIIRNCSRNGICIRGGKLRGEFWDPSTNVIIRGNLIEGVGGDGILPTACDAPLVEWNIMQDCPRWGKEVGAAAGMWPWACDRALFQFNEVRGHKAWNDAQGYDCDYSCKGTVFQYNLSINNEGGFMLICSPGIKKKGWLVHNAVNEGSVVRYNLSINDGSRRVGHKNYSSPSFLITGNSTTNTHIFRNILILPRKEDPKMDTSLITFGAWGGAAAQNTSITENAFVLLNGQVGTFKHHQTMVNTTFRENRFYGNVQPIPKHPQVSSIRNRYSKDIPTQIDLNGPKHELEAFQSFLEKKRNPQRDHGIRIHWIGQ